jgi:hypothetical protein
LRGPPALRVVLPVFVVLRRTERADRVAAHPVAITHRLGYRTGVPTVLRVGAFRVVIYLPPREHEPPHVHVWKGDGEVVIELARADRSQLVREVSGMRISDVTKAFWIVEEHAAYLLTCWRKYHG